MATIKVRQNGPYLVDVPEDVKLVDWNGNEYRDPEAALHALPLRRVEEQAVL